MVDIVKKGTVVSQKYINILTDQRKRSTLLWAIRDIDFSKLYKSDSSVNTLNKLKENLLKILIDEVKQDKLDMNEGVESNRERINTIVGIVEEIACFYNQTLIRTLGFFFSKILQKQFSGLYVNEENILKLKSVIGNAPFIFVPSHRSYGDFILMAFICFTLNIHIPCVAAGIDFKNMKLIGTLLRYCKAFFIRRSFSEKMSYKNIFQRYLQQLIIFGQYPVEFFIEGTRSRSGKALSPKFGLLKMILDTFHYGDVPDIIFIPVNLSYERIMEDKLFCYELLGVPKPRETTSGFFKALNMFDERYGNVYVHFDEPLSLREFMRKRNYSCDIRDHGILLEDLGHYIVSQQQGMQIVSYIHLLCVLLNKEYMQRGSVSLEKSEAVSLLSSLVDLANKFEVSMALSEDRSSCLAHSLRVHRSFLCLSEFGEIQLVFPPQIPSDCLNRLKGAQLQVDVLREAVPILYLQLYINPLLTSLSCPALILLVIKHASSITRQDLLEELNFLNSIFVFEFSSHSFNAEYFESCVGRLLELGLVEQEGDKLRVTGPSELTLCLVHMIFPFLVTYQSTFAIFCKDPLLSKSVEYVTQEAQSLIQEKIVNKYQYHHASLSLDSISLAIDSLISKQILTKFTSDGCLLLAVSNISLLKQTSSKLNSFVIHYNYNWTKDLNCKL